MTGCVGKRRFSKPADMGNFLKETDRWMRRRIRMVFRKRWKRVRTWYRNLRKLGINHENVIRHANTGKGCRRIAGSQILTTTLTNGRLEKDGFTFFAFYYRSVAA